MPRKRKSSRRYVVEQLQEDDPESFFKYRYESKLTNGMTQDQMDFLKAIEDLSIQKVRGFLDKGLDPNFFIIHCGTQQRQANVEPNLLPLHLAVSTKEKGQAGLTCEKIVGVLLFFGADPNCKDRHGNSALHIACRHGNLAAARLLMQAGADATAVNKKQDTALMHLCRNLECKEQTVDIVNLLIEAGCPVNYTNDKMKSALILLSSDGAPQLPSSQRVLVMKTLLRHGASVNAKDSKGKSALIYELQKTTITLGRLDFHDSSRMEALQALLSAGAWLYNVDDIHIDLTISEVDGRPLLDLLPTVFAILSRGQLALFQALAHRMALLCHNPVWPRAQEIHSLEKCIEERLCLVPSLLQLCRIAVRASLLGDTEVLSRTRRNSIRKEENSREIYTNERRDSRTNVQTEERGGETSNGGDSTSQREASYSEGDGKSRSQCSDNASRVNQTDCVGESGDQVACEGRRESDSVYNQTEQMEELEERMQDVVFSDKSAPGTDSGDKGRRSGRRRKRRRKGIFEGVAALPLPQRMRDYLLSSV